METELKFYADDKIPFSNWFYLLKKYWKMKEKEDVVFQCHIFLYLKHQKYFWLNVGKRGHFFIKKQLLLEFFLIQWTWFVLQCKIFFRHRSKAGTSSSLIFKNYREAETLAFLVALWAKLFESTLIVSSYGARRNLLGACWEPTVALEIIGSSI